MAGGLVMRLPVINPNAYKVIARKANMLWRHSIQAFVESLANNNRVQVDTGMSKAQILPLARAVRMVGAARATIHPRRASRRGYSELGGSWNASSERSMAHGEELGQDAFIITYGTPQNPIMTFKFRLVVFQYWLHDNGLGNQAAWGSVKHAQAAMERFFERHKGDARYRLAPTELFTIFKIG